MSQQMGERNKKEKKEKYKRKNIKFSHDAPESEGLDIPCSAEKVGKKEKNIKKSSLRSLTH